MKDSTLWCISAWNDNGKNGQVHGNNYNSEQRSENWRFHVCFRVGDEFGSLVGILLMDYIANFICKRAFFIYYRHPSIHAFIHIFIYIYSCLTYEFTKILIYIYASNVTYFLTSHIHQVSDNKKLYRSDFFGGLGWMLTANTWNEVLSSFPFSCWSLCVESRSCLLSSAWGLFMCDLVFFSLASYCHAFRCMLSAGPQVAAVVLGWLDEVACPAQGPCLCPPRDIPYTNIWAVCVCVCVNRIEKSISWRKHKRNAPFLES